MIELKLSQGAKPGHGGVLPAAKVSPEIAATRGVPMGHDCVSPAQHSEFSTPVGLLQFVALLGRDAEERAAAAALRAEFSLEVPVVQAVADDAEIDAEGIAARVRQAVADQAAQREQQVGVDNMRMLEKHIMLNVLDQSWKEHLARMDFLRQGIHLRGYAQKQPKQEYKREAYELFSNMLEEVKRQVVSMLSRVRIRTEEEIAALEAQERAQQQMQARQMQFQHADAGGYGADEEAAQAQAAQFAARQQQEPAMPKVGRNDPCPCGSGKKYKHCHGQL